MQEAQSSTQNAQIMAKVADYFKEGQVDVSEAAEFVRNLFNMEEFTEEVSGLGELGQCLCDSIEGVLDENKGKGIAVLLTQVLKSMEQFQYQAGAAASSCILQTHKIRNFIIETCREEASSCEHSLKLKQAVKQFISDANINKLSKLVTAEKNHKAKLGLFYVLVTAFGFQGLKQQLAPATLQAIMQTFETEGDKFLKQHVKALSNKQIVLFYQICRQYEQKCFEFTHEIRGRGYSFLMLCAVLLLSVDNLEKKFVAIQLLDSLTEYVEMRNTQKVSHKIHLKIGSDQVIEAILDPRTHQEVVGRSVRFMSYWLGHSSSEQELRHLKFWLCNLVVKSDIRTSKIFSEAFEKVISQVNFSKVTQIQVIYEMVLQIIRAQINKKSKGVSTRSQANQSAQRQQIIGKIISIIRPLINRRFDPFQAYEEPMFKFLCELDIIKDDKIDEFADSIRQQLLGCMGKFISPFFNLYVLDRSLEKFKEVVAKSNVKQKDSNTEEIEPKVTVTYSEVRGFVKPFLLIQQNDLDLPQSMKERAQEIFNKGAQALANKQILGDFIISHNSNSEPQAKILLSMIEQLMLFLNDRDLERGIIKMVLDKVDKSYNFFLEWAKSRIDKLQNGQIRTQICNSLFCNPEIYSTVTLAGFRTLLSILPVYDTSHETKQTFCLRVISVLSQAIKQEAINLMLHVILGQSELRTKPEVLSLVDKVSSFDPATQMQVFIGMINVSEAKCPTRRQVFSELIAVKEDVEVELVVHSDDSFSKKVTCLDCVSFHRFRIGHIQPLVSTQQYKKLGVQKIRFNNQEINTNNQHNSLRTLGFKSEATNIVHIELANKNYLQIKNMQDVELKNIVDSSYGHLLLTKDIGEQMQRSNLRLLKQLIVKEGHNLNFRLESLSKQNLFTILNNLAKLVLSRHKGLNKFLLQFCDEMCLLIQQLKNQTEGQHNNHQSEAIQMRNLMSEQRCFLELGFQNLDSPGSQNNKQREQKNSCLTTQQVAYNFLSMLCVNPEVETYICQHIANYINEDPIRKPYLILFSVESLYIALKKLDNMAAFSQTSVSLQILNLVFRCSEIMRKRTKETEKIQPILNKIIGTGLKVFNQIIRICLIKSNRVQLSLITRSQRDLLDLEETKKNIQFIATTDLSAINHQSPEHKQAREVVQFMNSHKLQPFLHIDCPKFTAVLNNWCINIQQQEVMDLGPDESFVLYEILRLNCWVMTEAMTKQEQIDLIRLLCANLDRRCKKLSMFSRSVLYIYLKLNIKQNSRTILKCLLGNIGLENSLVYFQIFSQCFSFCSQPQLQQNIIKKLFQLLFQSKPQQEGQGSNPIVRGIIYILQKNASKLGTDSVEFLLEILLKNFLLVDNGEIKAVSPQTRKIAYHCILTCLQSHPQVGAGNIFEELVRRIKQCNQIQSDRRAHNLGVGLQNLGNTCYMNSLLQMLHGIDPFVKDVLDLDSQFQLLKGLQSLFFNMSKSQLRSITTSDFITKFEPPINPAEQQDASQFLIQLLDKLDTGDATHKFEQLTKQYFRGQTVSSFSCSECKQGKQLTEDFILYSVPLVDEGKQFSTLEQCLEHNKKPEAVYDVQCDTCRGKRKFTKAGRPSKIPSYFIVHLRRLVFDYSNQYNKIKIHSRLEFPQQLTLHNQRLSLKAVITHQGTGQYGHYFTSVKQEGRWVLYNDSKVSELQEDEKQALWYGGNDNGQNYSTNAYVLLYEKKKPKMQTIVIDDKTSQHLRQWQGEISKLNNKLTIKNLLLGVDYAKDFVDFCFNLVLVPQTEDKMKRVYQLLATLSYASSFILSTDPEDYFSRLHDASDKKKLIQIVYEYREHNDLFLFRKDSQIRRFFYFFMVKVFETCHECKQTYVYAEELVINCYGLVRQNDNFRESGYYLKLISFLLAKIGHQPDFLACIYEHKLIFNLFAEMIKRKVQISANYQSFNVELIGPFLQLLVNYLKVSQSETIRSACFELTEQTAQFIVQSMGEVAEIAFMCNSNQHGMQEIIEMLGLLHDDTFTARLLGIIEDRVEDWGTLGRASTVNLCNLINFMNHKYFGSQAERQQKFANLIFGCVFPVQGAMPRDENDFRILSLNDRVYRCLTPKMRPSFLEAISQLIDKALSQHKINLQTVQILQIFINMLSRILRKNPSYVRVLEGIPSPCAMYSEYLEYQWASITRLRRKAEQSSQDNRVREAMQKLYGHLVKIREIVKNSGMDTQEDDFYLCGVSGQGSCVPVDCPLGEGLFLRVEELSYFWIKDKQRSQQFLSPFLDAEKKLLAGYKHNQPLLHFFHPAQTAQIQQQGSQQPTPAQFQMQQHSPSPVPHQSPLRRKILISNANSHPLTVHLQLECSNMRNLVIEAQLVVGGDRTEVLWVEKRKVEAGWGQMRLRVNGLELGVPEEGGQRTYLEGMDMM